MAARPTHDLAIKTGEYPDRDTGQMRPRWLRIGALIRHEDGGLSVKLDCLPIGIPGWEGWVSVFKRESAGQGAQQQAGRNARPARAPAPAQDFDDDIPF